MTAKTILMAAAALSAVVSPVAASAANPASALSLKPTVRAGKATKGQHAAQAGWIVGLGMIALGAGAIVLAVDDDNSPDSN